MNTLLCLLFSLMIAGNASQPLPPVPAEGTSLVVTADSISLHSRHDYSESTSEQAFSVGKGERLVIVQSEPDAADSTQIWVELAQDQRPSGWIKWQELIRNTAPSGPISRLLHKAMSPLGKYVTSILALAALCLCVLLIRKRREIYFSAAAAALFLLLATFILCFSSVDPRLWNYYLQPTLWPFAHLMPFTLRLVLIMFWANIVLWLAAFLSLHGDTYMVCTRCGHSLKKNIEKCPHCGAIYKQ